MIYFCILYVTAISDSIDFDLTENCPPFDHTEKCGKESFSVENCGSYSNVPEECPILCGHCTGLYVFWIIPIFDVQVLQSKDTNSFARHN